MVLKSLVAFVLSVMVPAVFACTPVRNMGIQFQRNSSHISASQVFELANWIVDLRVKYPNREAIYISASSDIEERGAERLAWKRAGAVRQAIDVLQFTATEIHSPKEVEVVKAGSFGPGRRNDVKRVDVEFLPGCPHECACQSGGTS